MNIREWFGFLFYTHAPGLICLCALSVVYFLARVIWRSDAEAKLSAVNERVLPFASWAMIAAIFGLVVLNTVFPSFVWLGDPQLASTSFLLGKGFPLYHPADYPERYSLLYGPMSYLPSMAIFWFFGATVITAKLANGIFLLAVFGVAAFIVVRATSKPALGLAAFMVVLLPLIFATPLILLSSLTAYCVYFISRWRFRTIVIGLCVGLACGTKIHAGLYFCPIFVDLLWRRKWGDLVLLGASSAVTIGAPFLIPGIDVKNYFFWLHAAAEHGLLWRTFVYQCEWCAYGFSIVGAALFFVLKYRGEKPVQKSCPWPVRATAAGAIFLVMLVASKAGSTFHHLLPLVPCYVIVLWPWAEKSAAQRQSSGRIPLLTVLAGTYLLIILVFDAISVAHLYAQILRVPAVAVQRDVNRILAEHPGARIVAGDAESVPGEWQDNPGVHGRFAEPLLLFKGQPFLYDPVALMDMQKSGLPIPEATVDRLRDGSIDIWLFPKGCEPFNIVNWYDSKTPVFSKEFRDAFFANYQRDGTSEFYDLWSFRRR